MAGASYKQRYVAFVDILAYRQFVLRLRANKRNVEAHRKMLEKLHRPPNFGTFAGGKRADVRAQSISDAVAISTEVSLEGFFHLSMSLDMLTLDLLAKGFFVRGALVKGHVYHDENMIFGEGLVRAVNLEAEVSRYPRILVERAVVRDYKKYRKKFSHVFEKTLRQADDGPMYLHSLRFAEEMFKTEERDFSELSLLKKQIERRFTEAMDNPHHFEKVQWFAKYWNSSIPDPDRFGLRIRSEERRVGKECRL